MPRLIRQVKLPAYTKNDIWVLLAIVPAQVLICNRIMIGPDYFSQWKTFFTGTGIFFLMMFITFQLCGLLALRFLKIFPAIEQTPLRMVISITSFITITIIMLMPLMSIYSMIPYLNYRFTGLIDLRIASVSALGSLIITIIFEGLAAFERWKATLFETEQLKKENLRSQLQSLKNQVNPHFLFNNINSLSSLISDDPDKAENFLDEMCKVYRYLLRNNEDQLVSLQSELHFIKSYFHLLKTRYGNAIELKLDVNEECCRCLLPPLTLQMLIENALKHNVISRDHPLCMEIICGGNEQLSFRNNIQRKKTIEEPSNTGLMNIASRFHLLGQPDPCIEESGNCFTVVIPLIPVENLS
jgi:LytS/YehU family sensor histidine kinase